MTDSIPRDEAGNLCSACLDHAGPCICAVDCGEQQCRGDRLDESKALPTIEPLPTTIEYDWDAAPPGWSIVLHCTEPCACGETNSVGPFPSRAAAVACDDQLQAGWRDSELRRIAREARESMG
jgi:hypothetical protein